MTAVMSLCRVLVLLSAVLVCHGVTTPSGAAQDTEATASSTHHTTPNTLGTVPTANSPPQTQSTITTTSQKANTAVTSVSTSAQTSDGAEGNGTSALPLNTTTEQASAETAPQGPSPSATSASSDFIVAASTAAAPHSDPSSDWETGDFETNPGVVAVVCIFCIFFVLILVVTAIRYFRSSRSNFERLDDVPLDKVTEDSPFAHHSK